MKKLWSVLLTVLLTMSLLTGCGASDTETKGTEEAENSSGSGETTFGITPMEEATTINLGYFSGTLHAVPFYIMEQEGFLDELNMEFEYQSFVNGPAMMEASSSWDICSTGGPGGISGVLGYDVSIIGVCDNDSMLNLYVREDSPIYKAGKGHVEDYPDIYGTPEDWKGTTWILPVGTTMHKVLGSTLEKLGLTLDDVNVINMDVTSALSAFKAGEADGLGVWISVALSAEEAGFKKVGGAAINEDIIPTVLMATDEALDTKYEAICKVYELYYKTVEWCYEHPEEFAQHFYDTCEIEGIACSEDVAQKITENFQSYDLEYMVDYMTSEYDDDPGLAKRKVSGAERDILNLFDFFMGLDMYTKEDRDFIIDNNKITNIVAKSIQEEMAKQDSET